MYSREFYEAARRRLKPGGILHQWYPGTGDDRVNVGVLRAVKESFPHVRAFRSFEGWGLHIIASDRPLPAVTGEALAAKLPPAAVADLVEWEPGATPESIFDAIVAGELPLEAIIALLPRPGADR